VRIRRERRHLMAYTSFPGYGNAVAIASGAFATVYRAVELGTSRPVALKVLRMTDVARSEPEHIQEQLEQLVLLSKHPNVTTIYRTFFTDEGLPVLVMELYRESLARHLDRTGPLPPALVVPMAIKVAGALETAHRAGLVHGGVKPENILVSQLGEPVLGDFGLATLQAAAQSAEHLAGDTTLHAAPEAFEDQALSPSADIYGLASSMYQLLLGRGPFVTYSGEAPASVILRLMRDPAPRPPLGAMPIALADLLESALAKDPTGRPQSAAAFAESLRAVEAAAGWPKTPFVVLGARELAATRPVLVAPAPRAALAAGPGSEAARARASGGAAGATPAGAPPAAGLVAEGASRVTIGPGLPDGTPGTAGRQGGTVGSTGVPAAAPATAQPGTSDRTAGAGPGGDVPAPSFRGAMTTEEPALERPADEEVVPPGTRRVIMPPPVERTVVVPEPVGRRLSIRTSSTSPGQGHWRPKSLPR